MKVAGRCKGYLCLIVLLFGLSTVINIIFIGEDDYISTSTNYTALDQVDVNFPITKENIPYTFFDERNIYMIKTETVSSQTQEDKDLFRNAKLIAAKYIHTSLTNFQYGQYRLLGKGVEFDIYFRFANSYNKRISVFFPLGSPKGIFVHDEKKVPEIVNIILPLKGKMKSLEAFADNILLNIYPVDDRISLTVVYFRDEDEPEAKNILQTKFASIPKFNWTLLTNSQPIFSRGQAIQLGANYVGRKASDLLFFCDVDIIMRANFFRRCRTNTIQSHQVYYPIVFSLYNTSLIYGTKVYKGLKIPLVVNKDNGFWRNFGYGMLCLYKEDFDLVGGIPNINSWGGEDLILFSKLSKMKNIKYIRTPDPDLFHSYHHKDCRNVSKSSRNSCLKSKVFTEGSQLQLGLALFKISEDVDLGHIYDCLFNNIFYIALSILLVVSLCFNLLLLFLVLKFMWAGRFIPYYRPV